MPDADLRKDLDRALHGNPCGLLLTAVSGVAAGGIAIVETESRLLQAAGAVLVALAILRSAMAWVALVEGRSGRWARSSYAPGALANGLAAGMAAALAILLPASPHVQLVLAGYAMLSGAKIAAGTAARPDIALGQMAFTFLPVVAACLYVGTLPMLVLAAIVPALAGGLAFAVINIFVTVSDQARSARERERQAEQMHRQARIDTVTGLLNRHGLEQALQEIAGGPTASVQLSLLWLDLHHFKDVNETLGHGTGDKVLAEMADRLRSLAPPTSTLARFGSDEFVIACPGMARREAETLAARICSELARPVRISGHLIESGAAVGVAVSENGQPDCDRLLEQADLALYHAKYAGRHQSCLFEPEMTRELVRRKEVEAELRAAILRDELSIYFQPILDLRTGRIRAFEALVRWFHPEKGEIVPDEFIPVAEETGLIITLGNWITRMAARTCATWPEHITLAVNLSPVQIRAPGASLGILNALREAGLDPARLELEVTESLFVEDDADTAAFMDELAGHGIGFALDDFGTGNSSLHYINRYPFRSIKVDRSFVSGPRIDRRSDAIVRAVAEMGTVLGMDIVAEGLETAEQVDAVRDAGCTLGQGYHFSRAVPDHLAARLIDEERRALGADRLTG